MTQKEKLDLLELYIEDLIHRLLIVKVASVNDPLVSELDSKIDFIKKKILEEIKF